VRAAAALPAEGPPTLEIDVVRPAAGAISKFRVMNDGNYASGNMLN